MNQEVIYSVENGSAIITLNRPNRANSLNSEMSLKVIESIKKSEEDINVHCVVITGNGKFFCTGMDLSGALSSDGNNDPSKLFDSIYECKKPTIAKINGPVIGGGLGIMFACDVRILSDLSYLQFSEVLRGIAPAYISVYIVKELGLFKSKQYMMSGEKVDINEIGKGDYVTKIVPHLELDKATNHYIELFKKSAPNALSKIKELVKFVSENKKIDNLKKASVVFDWMMKSEEAQYGINSFLQKQIPNWKEFHSNKGHSKL
eukprot:TRINITY_DN12125_c0_g1_i1.p1 TRINITY_DN12125_c0_g1~~TRINITY_DN12125_c0_g1_i1.p1  ORF type:complete len:261 (-),score=71.48 TRINITY_DN12125_c0_g1_i1:37-819(-)